MFSDFFKNPEAVELQKKVAYLLEQRDRIANRVDRAERSVYDLQRVTTSLPPAPAANILWNGEIGHSVNSWFDSAYTTDDKSKEAAHFFSHHAPRSPQTFTSIAVADTVPVTAHSLVTGQEVRFRTTGSLPTGLAAATSYFVIEVDDDNFKVAASRADAYSGTAVGVTSGTGSGTHTVYTFLDATDARASSGNSALKNDSHTNYDPRFSDWDSARGQARLSATTTVDQPLPSNQIEPGNLVYASMVAALRNRYMEFTETARVFHGLWDNTAGRNDFLSGSAALTGTVAGTPAGTLERRYRIYVETDRGYSLLSNEVTLAGAPDDASFSTSAYVQLSWRPLVGVLRVQVWRYTPASGDYHLLEEISSGATSYIDLNSFLRTDTGYPAAAETERKAVYYSLSGELAALSVDGVDGAWSTVRSVVYVPDNYDKSATTDRQWLRTGITEDADLVVGEITSDGTSNITAPAADATHPTAFESVYASLFAGLTVKIYDSTGALTLTTTIVSHTSETELKLNDAVPTASGQTLRIVGGGFHAVLFDKIHITYQSNAGWAANPLDVRTLQPVAAPSSGTQGTTGTGGTGGIDHCLTSDTPVDGFRATIPIGSIARGEYLRGEAMRPNLVTGVKVALAAVRLVKVSTPDGVWQARMTDGERFRTDEFDAKGKPLYTLRVGDTVMVNLDGTDALGIISFIGEQEKPDWVYHPSLQGGHYFRGGTFKPSLWRRLLEALGLKPKARGGIYFHNNKSPDIPL